MLEHCIQLKKSNCKNCYKCIRNCPVKSIRFEDNQAHIIHDECVLCGECTLVCPQNARLIRDDIYLVKKAINAGKKVVASVAPSFIANFDNINFASIRQTLINLGFYDAEETAIGATLVKKEYEKLIANQSQDVIISSCCHTVNLTIQKYYPDLVDNIAHVKSPMTAHAQTIKDRINDAFVVFIGPCISKKDEADKYPGLVDVVLTFEELTSWMNSSKLDMCRVEEEKSTKSKARLFPTSGGILKTMDCTSEEYIYIQIDGMKNVMAALDDIKAKKMSKCFIEMSACAGSCVNGPAMDKKHRLPVRDYYYVDKYAGKSDFDITNYQSTNLDKDLPFIGFYRALPSEKEIQELLIEMGKTSKDKELNCGSCGYNTCREKAVAIYQGKAIKEMCLPFLKEKAESFSNNIVENTPNGIMVLNSKFEIQLINKALCRFLKIKRPSDVIKRNVSLIIDPTPYEEILKGGKTVYSRKTFLAEYQKFVEETIIYDSEYKIIMSIMRDITAQEKELEQRELMAKRTVEITDKVIDRQMVAVQEIASLLGETTAETKLALSKLREILSNE